MAPSIAVVVHDISLADPQPLLEPLGLQPFDEAVYRRLLRAPASSPADIAEVLQASPARVRGALARLGQAGLVRASADGRRPGRLQIAEPSAALGALLRRRREELDQAAGAVGEFVTDYRSGALATAPAQIIDVVSGTAEVVRRTSDLARAVERDILVFDTPPYASDLNGEVARELSRLQRGVRIQSLYSASALRDPARLARVRALVSAGEQARVLPELPLKLHIYDRQTAVVPLVSTPWAAESVAIVGESGLLEALIALFDALWERGHPLGRGPGEFQNETPGAPPDDEVLGLLAAGVKDDAIARYLGISVRTARRRVTRLLSTLDATSRFQAGAAAQRRGWLS